MPTVAHGDFEWDDDKARSNFAKHDVTFEEAAFAMIDAHSLDFDDDLEPDNLITLAASPAGRIFSCRPFEVIASESSVPATQPSANDVSMKKQNDPKSESLEEMPEIDAKRFHRRPGRGHHASLSVGEIVTIDADLWLHFGSSQAVNDALRQLVNEKKPG